MPGTQDILKSTARLREKVESDRAQAYLLSSLLIMSLYLAVVLQVRLSTAKNCQSAEAPLRRPWSDRSSGLIGALPGHGAT